MPDFREGGMDGKFGLKGRKTPFSRAFERNLTKMFPERLGPINYISLAKIPFQLQNFGGKVENNAF